MLIRFEHLRQAIDPSTSNTTIGVSIVTLPHPFFIMKVIFVQLDIARMSVIVSLEAKVVVIAYVIIKITLLACRGFSLDFVSLGVAANLDSIHTFSNIPLRGHLGTPDLVVVSIIGVLQFS